MLKGEISYSAGAMSRNTDLKVCIDIIREAGFKVTDFWLWKYSNPDGPMCQENWREWIMDVKAYLDAAGIRVGQVHALWDHDNQINEDYSYDLPRQVFKDSFEACAMLGSKRLIFHPIERWFRMEDEGGRKKVLDANIEWYKALIPSAEKWGVELHIENLFDHQHVFQPGDPVFPGSTPDDILYIIDGIGSPLAKACLDSGHANIAGQDVPAMIRKYAGKLGSLHLNDNYGKIGPIYEDLHLCPSYGRLPWKDIFEALEEIGYEDTLNMEVNAEIPKIPIPLRVIQLKTSIAVMNTMRELYGK